MPQVSPQMASQESRLHVRYEPHGDALLEEPVRHGALLASLVLGQGRATPLFVEAHRAARRPVEVVGANLTAVDHAEHEPIRDRGPQFLHQVQRQGGPPRAERVQVAHLRVEANAFERSLAFGTEQRVAE